MVDVPTPGVPRRTAVAGAVVLAGAAAGCARYGGPNTPDADDAAPAAQSTGTVLGAAADVPVGGGTVFKEQKLVVTQPTKGEFKGFSAVCTHQGCLVAAVTKTIDCDCHGSKFAVADGSVANGPATQALAAQAVSVTAEGQLVTGDSPAAAEPETTPETTEPDPQTTEAEAPPPAGLASTDEIPLGGGKVFDAEQVVLTQPTEGEFKCFSAICTHQGCAVATITDGTINCPCHGSKFAIADGSVAAGPAGSPLEEKTVQVTGDQISLA